MKLVLRGLLVITAISAAVPLTLASAQAAVLTGYALLNGAQERPVPVDTLAQGTAILSVDTDTNTLSNFSLLVSGIERPDLFEVGGGQGAVHIHEGPVDGTGGIVVPFGLDRVTAFEGGFIVNALDVSITSSVIAAMRGGQAYVNVHTNEFPSGEIRGLVYLTPIPAALPLLASALGGLGYAAWRRRRG
jgi:hypothetical protein